VNVSDLKVPIASVVAIVAVCYGLWETYATKSYVREIQAPISKALPELTEAVQRNAKNSTRALSLDLADDLSRLYNRLCYEDFAPAQRIRILEIISRWEAEYLELTGRPYEPGECSQ
jgi:hypothetical protein